MLTPPTLQLLQALAMMPPLPPFWFGRSARRKSEHDIQPGARYRRQLGGRLVATATVLALRPDLSGISHIHFAITIHGPSGLQSAGEARVLALRSFLDTYRGRLP